MAISANEIKEAVKAPSKSQTISKAVKHEQRLKFHVESYAKEGVISGAAGTFLNWVNGLIPKDKYNVFTQLFTFPTQSIKLTSKIYQELERVFDGRNASISFQFRDAELLTDWSEYRREVLKEPIFWRTTAWSAVQTAINSVLVVDMPKEQTGERPEPYFYLLDISQVVDYKLASDNVFDYIIFNQPGGNKAVIDDEYYRLIDDKDNIILENKHDLGYCPARFFWSTPMSSENKDLKKSPLSAQLADLDWYLFYATSKRHLDLYASYPIYSAYAEDCDYEDTESGDYCDGSYLRNREGKYKYLSPGTLMPCPKCGERQLSGPGSIIDVPAPKGKDDADLRDPVSITTIDKDSLDYNVEEVSRRAREIFESAVGSDGELLKTQSINEDQVNASFESKTSILSNLAMNLEAAQKFADDTAARLRYGDNYLGSSISYGTEFYIYSIADLYNRYKQAKENGASKAELDAISGEIQALRYKTDPGMANRMNILNELEPFPGYTLDELLKLGDKVDPRLLKVKLNFPAYIRKFERENMDVVNFGSETDFDKKINTILETLISYTNDKRNEN